MHLFAVRWVYLLLIYGPQRSAAQTDPKRAAPKESHTHTQREPHPREPHPKKEKGGGGSV
jgi:hypothetical protein